MPTYEYACRSCGHHLEVVQSFHDEPLTECPACQKRSLRKVFSPVGIAFKGSGFYKTDTRSKSKTASGAKSSTPADTTAKSEKATKSESKSDSGSGSPSGSGEAKTA